MTETDELVSHPSDLATATGGAYAWAGLAVDARSTLEVAVEKAFVERHHPAHLLALVYLTIVEFDDAATASARDAASVAIETAERLGLDEYYGIAPAYAIRARTESDPGLARDGASTALRLARRASTDLALALVLTASGDTLNDLEAGSGTDLLIEARSIIDRCPDPGIAGRYLARAESRHRVSEAPPGAVGALIEQLTDREMAVLQYLPTTMSQRGIASELYVSLNTGKTHCRAIYRKLGVGDRKAAVQAARDLSAEISPTAWRTMRLVRTHAGPGRRSGPRHIDSLSDLCSASATCRALGGSVEMRDDGHARATVVAVVVTFNRRAVAARCLRAILDQDVPPDVVVLVDNGEAAETELELKRRGMGLDELDGRIRLVAMEVNSGPGGGFSRGFAEAMEQHSPDYLWVMDDDVVPEPGALGALLERAGTDGGDALYWPRVSSPGRPDNFNPGWYGVLIPSRLVEQHGLPRADFVWWAEDTEYLQWRLEERAGVRSTRVPEARVHHEESSRGGSPPCWKLYYEVRNSIYLRLALKRYNYWRLIRLAAFAARQVAVHPHRRRRAARALRGASDGVRGRLGLRVALLPD